MAEPKNIFNFGTGDIDKDQWLRDIDSELEDFISKYGMATNKHRTALLRQAFQDLRTRIANGDMLNRTADGRYQFGSMLNRDDKHMQEAYERALGFMGGLARRQITAPPAEPEKKKYNTKTLNDRFIRFFNPSGNLEAFTSLWNSYDDNTRKTKLLEFLRSELNTGLNNYQDVEDYDSMDNLRTRINNFIADPNITNLNSLGFNKNYLSQLTTEEEEKPKSELEQVQSDIAAAQEAQQVAQGRLYLSYNANRGTTNFDLSIPAYDFNRALLNHLNSVLNDAQLHLAAVFNPNFNPSEAKAEQARKYIALQQQNLNNYFAHFATSWRPNYESGLSNRDTMQNYLSRLFATYNKGTNADGTPITDYVYDWNKYFTLIGDNQFLINGSLDKTTGRYAYYVPGQGIRESNILDTSNPHIAQLLGYTIPSLKEGGKVKFLQSGGEFDYNAWAASQEEPTMQVVSKPLQTSTPKLKVSSREMTAADIAAISADIGSIAASFVPGYGTAASAILGVGSTLSNFISDVNDSNTSLGDALWNGAKGLGADAIGLVPGFGAGAKGWKIATRLAKYGTSILAGLNTLNLALNSPEIMNSFKKVLSLKTDDMDLLDWRNIQNGLSMLATAGRLGHGIAVHKGYKGQLKAHNQQPLNVKPEPKTKLDKAKAKLTDYRDKLKGIGATYDYGGPNTLPWYHDANIYLWGANRSGFNLGLKNPYKVDMSTKLLQPPKPKRKRTTNHKSKQEKSKSTLPSDRGLVWNEQTHSYVRTKEIGGVLKALRNGGILKADAGLLFPDLKPELNFNSQYYQNWVNLNWNNPENFQAILKGYKPGGASYRISNGLPAKGGEPKKRYENSQGEQDFMSAYQELQAYYDKDAGSHIFGDVLNYYNLHWLPSNLGRTYEDFIKDYNSNVDRLRKDASKKLTGVANLDKTWGEYNTLFNLMYANYSPFSEGLKDTLGESTWRRTPNTFNGINDRENLRYGLLNPKDPKSKVILDNEGHLIIPDLLLDSEGNDPASKTQAKKGGVDSASGRETIITPDYKNPFDPSLLISAAKYFAGLRGNRDIYQNLLDEMPEAPLRDPLDRKLAIVGWQERIKNGLNQLADLRRIQLIQQGSDQLTNFATALETERTGRDIMDKAFAEDSGRQFETALKSWNLDNEDILYNTGVGDANRRSIADRQRMMAQIRAAWRSGDQNLKMGLLADAGNWFMKRYQREQDLVDKAKELSLGTPEEWAQSEYTSRLGELANKKASDLTEADKAKIQAIKAQVMQEMRQNYSNRYYNLYHTPGFGGGLGYALMSKNGSKLEVAKLKARSKDNDRYVSMIKDLRKRRRR